MTHQATSTYIPRHIRREHRLGKTHYWASCSCGAHVGFRLVLDDGRLRDRAEVARIAVATRATGCPALPLAVATAYSRSIQGRAEGGRA